MTRSSHCLYLRVLSLLSSRLACVYGKDSPKICLATSLLSFRQGQLPWIWSMGSTAFQCTRLSSCRPTFLPNLKMDPVLRGLVLCRDHRATGQTGQPGSLRNRATGQPGNRAAGQPGNRATGQLGRGEMQQFAKRQKGHSKNCFYEVSTSKIPSTKLCEGFCLF